jgi:hypothetical protein
MLLIAAVLVFLVGITLFVLTEQTDRYFAWTIASPLTAAFLGAAYWSSALLEVLAARERLWANARPAVPAVIIFTILTLVVTLIHVDKFHFGAPELITRAGTWFWLAVYAVVPVVMLAFLFQQQSLPGKQPEVALPMPAWMRVLLMLIAAVLLAFGVALLLAPQQAGALWPWALTALTARAIGAWLVGLGTAAWQVARERDLRRGRAVLATAALFCVLEALALARYPGDVRWSAPEAVVYIAFLVLFFVVGLVGIALQRRAHSA